MKLPFTVYARLRQDRQGDTYSLFYGEEPKNLFGNEKSIYLGEIKTEEQYNKISFMNGRASVQQLKNEMDG